MSEIEWSNNPCWRFKKALEEIYNLINEKDFVSSEEIKKCIDKYLKGKNWRG